MLNVTKESTNYTPIRTEHYSLENFAEELIRILPSSPESFAHLLVLALDDRLGLEESDVNSLMSYITEQVGENQLYKYLSRLDRTNALTLSQTPEIDEEVISLLDKDGMQLAIIMARHMYKDMTETSYDICAHSEKALYNGVGEFITTYNFQGELITVATEIGTRISKVRIL
ncbi:hypothetical protein EXT65_21280 [Pectobacterium carotovorum subsp. carotovorum]|nr:hypothetical protein [Pectobacterium carotovorum]MCL6336328.1 hypothetical protein [Pectobacterium carotovorum subsp. carotovorum]